jgi:regulator of sirC expression with transglutaminase-like and TPR domain
LAAARPNGDVVIWLRRRLLQGLALGPLLAGPPACRRADPTATPLEQALLAVAAEAGFGGTDSRRAAVTELEHIASRVRAPGGAAADAEALRRTLFSDLSFVRVVQGLTARHMLLPPVLQDRRGSCVGLGCLFLALADRLGLNAWGVMVPGHFFVQVRQPGGVRNVELLRGGEAMPESWYRTKYGVPDDTCPAYLRPLTPAEVLAVVRFNLGNHHREAGDLARANDAYRRATQDFPGFPEAHASLGLTLHLQGQLSEARQAYQAARRLCPRLPGLDRNLAALDGEAKGDPR